MTENIFFRESTAKLVHRISVGAPCDWSRSHGATHTLHTDSEIIFHGKDSEGKELPTTRGGTRACKIMKTRIHVGIDENDVGGVEWEIWTGRFI
jgi:hypothetical protein